MSSLRHLRPTFSRALVLESPDPSLDAYLREQGFAVERLPEEATQDTSYVLERLRAFDPDLLFKRSRFEVNDAVLEAAPHLAAVMLCCIGDDSVDKAACARHGVLVMNDPISNGRSVAEMIFGEMIVLARRLFAAHEAGRQHLWTKDAVRRFELKGKTLGIVGLGNIGKQVAQMATAFGMHVRFFDTSEVAREVGVALGYTSCKTMMELFRTSDVVTLHVSAEDIRGASNEGLVSYDHLAALGDDCPAPSPRLLLNAARGFLFDLADLRRALDEGHVRAAAIDVFPEEPGSKKDPWTNPFAEHSGVVTTPHIGAATEEAQPRIAAYVAGTTRMFNETGTVRDTVYAPRVTIGVEADAPYHVLAVTHTDARGTKKAINDAIYESGANNLQSAHRDFPKYRYAYDVSAIDRPLTDEQIGRLIARADELSGQTGAIRSIRQFAVEKD